MEFENEQNYTYTEPVRKKSKKPFFNGLIVGILISGAFYGGIQAEKEFGKDKVEVSFANKNESNKTILPTQPVSKIVKEKSPAIVSIETNSVSKSSVYQFDDPLLKEFFGSQTPQQQQESTALGSGFIFDKSGYILTNQHVINNATSIKVKVQGYDTPFTAKLIGQDAEKDIAIIKINSEKTLPYLSFGDNTRVSVGDAVIAVGNPYGLDHTVTTGVISAKERPVNIENKNFSNLIQTDASINPGNSGGPLLDLNGNVIGINTAINAEAQNIGFAIPINDVEKLIKPLLTDGKIKKPWLGVAMQSVTKELAAYYGLSQDSGIVLTEVLEQTPAATAGLEQGDIIVEIDKKKVRKAEDMAKIIEKKKIGDKINLLLFRDGKMKSITVKIGEKP